MKILITVDPEIPVPPLYYGGIERIVDGLINQYTALGHEVHLIAHKDSSNLNALKTYYWPKKSSRGVFNILSNAFKLYKSYNRIKPDVVHSFSRLLYLYPLLIRFDSKKIRILQTYQREISSKSTAFAHKVFGKKLYFTACGAHLLNNLGIADVSTPIHNFTDTKFYNDDLNVSKEHLMFLGRIEDIKGTKECIDVAIATKNKLIIAGNIPSDKELYFETEIKPFLEHELIEYVGQVNDSQKLFYLQRSKAFLFPIKWEEPFGIVMAEAMACGTPVIGFRRGSVPEVIKDKETGFVVNNTEQMIKAVGKIHEIDREKVRKDCVERFSLEVIAKQYLEVLYKISLY